jgi:hypothetical protein
MEWAALYKGGLGRLPWFGKFFIYKFSISDFKSIPSVFFSFNRNSTQFVTFIRSPACRASLYFI